MNFDLNEDDQMAVEGFRRFLERDVRPIADQYGDVSIPKETAHQLLSMLSDYAIGCGWVPEDGGGLGISFLSSGLLYEALARVSADLAGLAFVHEGAAMKIYRSGTPALKERYLEGLMAGRLIGCSAVTEPGGGSGVRHMRTRAVLEGDYYRINGEKMFISNATIADVIMLTAKTGPQEFTMFLIDPREHKIETRELDMLGLNGWPLGQIAFSDTRVHKDFVVGGVGNGLRETMKGFERARCFISLLALGLSQAALDRSIAYVKEREQFGKPLGSYQLIQEMIVDMATELHAARLLVYRGLSMLDKGQRCNLEAAMAKTYATEAAIRITSKAIQVHGAFGLAREFPLERYFRSARMLTVPDGTTQINQLVIGRELLGLNAFGEAEPKAVAKVAG